MILCGLSRLSSEMAVRIVRMASAKRGSISLVSSLLPIVLAARRAWFLSSGSMPSRGRLSFSSTSLELLTVLSRDASRKATPTPNSSVSSMAIDTIGSLAGLTGTRGTTAGATILARALARSPVAEVSLSRLKKRS